MATNNLLRRDTTLKISGSSFPMICLSAVCLLLTACSSLDFENAEVVKIDGSSITVQASGNEPNTWAAYGTTLADRTPITPAYLSRNVTAIEAVSGCKVRPELTTHSIATTVAIVNC